jgi:hypothetical protein
VVKKLFPPPIREAISLKDRITRVWAEWFEKTVFDYLSRVDDLETLDSFAWSNAKQRNHEQRLKNLEVQLQTLLESDGNNYEQRLKNIETQLQVLLDFNTDLSSLQRIEQLEAMVHAQPVSTPLPAGSHIVDAATAHTITDPADSPVDADALRDDLVLNTIPDIESKLDALGTKINKVITRLEDKNISSKA